ncbi:hypothetical protein Afil01_04340 [Actinorhabdospora filicis]|uniref:Uncharacterized protein n=1 Tax=Actinorhabdospora filicis TaxID=1785913 RepID=A0A9W6SGM2_9ACTN|nr:hypothetical protein Afil01_04340 [Actinorhabdospora filicis]
MACSPPRADIIEHGLDEALATSRGLLARYETMLTKVSGPKAERLTAIRDDHRAHAERLARYIGPGADAITAAPHTEDDTTDTLHDAETAAYDEALTQCSGAANPQHARLLASIAANRAVHAAVLSG